MADQQQPPMRVFYSYSHKDATLRDELETHLAALRRSGAIEGWSDRAITGGQEWAGQIDQNLEAADIILLLISADFIASDYCYAKEMARALAKHAAGTARVVPIILRPVDWESTPFHKLQALPAGAKAVTTWPNRDEAWVDVARGLRQTIQSLAQERITRRNADQPEQTQGNSFFKRMAQTQAHLANAPSFAEVDCARDVTDDPAYAKMATAEGMPVLGVIRRIFVFKGQTIVLHFFGLLVLRRVFYNDTEVPFSNNPRGVHWPYQLAYPHFKGAFKVVEDGQNIEYVVASSNDAKTIAVLRNDIMRSLLP